MTTVSVVIPAYNSERFISRCLHSLENQQTDIPYEIIVVDSSKDSTPNIIRTHFPSVKLIHLETQTMPGAGRNIGVKEAKGEIIAFIDSDCVAHPHWINDAVRDIRSGYEIVGGSVANGNPETLVSIADHIITFNEFLPYMPRREVPFMPTCNFICTKKAFHDVGGFSDDLFAGEDTLFSYHAAKK
ncbi:TPA: glycosyltransferase, partial [Candidatus Woesearchaeota archaeon]|nr:glycosyltransferase [Candidatus Woesearchaeota archaeon]